MKPFRPLIISVLSLVTMTILSCSESTDDFPVSDLPNNTIPNSQTKLALIEKQYSAEEFLRLFVGKEWHEYSIREVCSNDSVGFNYYEELDGMSMVSYNVVNDSAIIERVEQEDPTADIFFDEGQFLYLGGLNNEIKFAKFKHQSFGSKESFDKSSTSYVVRIDSVLKILSVPDTYGRNGGIPKYMLYEYKCISK